MFRVFGVLGGFLGRLGVLGGLIVGFKVRQDKNDPKCNMVFDSDTFSEKCSKHLLN